MQTIHPHVIKPWTNTLISEWYQFAIMHLKARASQNLHKNIFIRIRWHWRSSKTISLANQSMAGPCTGYVGYKRHALGRKVFPAPPYFRRADMCTTPTQIGVLALLFFSSELWPSAARWSYCGRREEDRTKFCSIRWSVLASLSEYMIWSISKKHVRC